MVDLLVNPFLCLNDEDIVLPGFVEPLDALFFQIKKPRNKIRGFALSLFK
jgi:hypothetical protein